MSETRLNMPVYKGDPNLSSYSYLWAKFRDEPDMKASKLRIHHPKNCEHSHAVCIECVDSWSWDYDIDFARTVGGRMVLQNALDLNKEVRLPE